MDQEELLNIDDLEPITLSFSIKEYLMGGSNNDYRKLKNKPSINGTELIENYDEIDPTVPEWAKENSKPNYTAEEVGALDEDSEMSLTDVKGLWDLVFNQGGN